MALLEELESGEFELTMVQGDSAELPFTAVDDATPAAPVDLSKAVDGTAGFPAIIRFSVKDDPEGEANVDGLAFLTSYDSTEVEVLDQTVSGNLGKFLVRMDKPDTQDRGDPTAIYRWDVEVSRQGDARTGAAAGTAAVSTVGGVASVTGTGTAFAKAKEGDVFQIVGGPNAGVPSLIVSVADDTHLVLENPLLTDDAGFTFTIRRGVHKTLQRGPFTLLEGVVR